MADIVKKLRKYEDDCGESTWLLGPVFGAAADEIERLRSPWHDISVYDKMKTKPKPNQVVFWFEASIGPRITLSPTMQFQRFFGNRVCTKFMPLPPPPEDEDKDIRCALASGSEEGPCPVCGSDDHVCTPDIPGLRHCPYATPVSGGGE